MKLTKALAALMLAAAMLTFAACGDDDDDDGGGGGDEAAETTEAPAEPAAVTITATDDAVEVSGSTAPGVAEITLQNDGKKPATAQLIRVEGEHTEQEVVDAFRAAQRSGKIPDFILAEGGVSTTAPGESGVVTQELAEGQYYAFNDDDSANLKKGLYASFEVSGESAGGELPDAPTVTGSEYKFETDGPLAAGEPVAFENVGQQPHHLIAMQLKPGKTVQDAVKFFETEKGEPPIAGEPTGTTVIDGDRTVVADLGLKPGNYALVCFVSDREGGPPHVAKGMISEATVE
jgi:hypothetical protein